MILNHPVFNREISFNEIQTQLLVVEHQQFFRKMVFDFCLQSEGEDGEFILYDDKKNSPLHGSDHIRVITDYHGFDLSGRSMQNKLHQYLRTVMDENMKMESDRLKLNIQDYLQELSEHCDIPITFEVFSSMYPLVKAFEVNAVIEGENDISALFEYLDIVNFLFENQLHVLVGAMSFYDENELEELQKFAQYKKYNILLIENIKRERFGREGQVTIIDRDLCVI